MLLTTSSVSQQQSPTIRVVCSLERATVPLRIASFCHGGWEFFWTITVNVHTKEQKKKSKEKSKKTMTGNELDVPRRQLFRHFHVWKWPAEHFQCGDSIWEAVCDLSFMQYSAVMIVSPPLLLLQNCGGAQVDSKWFTAFSLFFILSFCEEHWRLLPPFAQVKRWQAVLCREWMSLQ